MGTLTDQARSSIDSNGAVVLLMGPWVILLVAVVAAVVWAAPRRDDDEPARRVLDRRLAQGELTVDEHARRRQVLHEQQRSVAPWRRRTPVAILATGVVLLVGALSLAGSSDWGQGGHRMGGHMGWGGSTSSTSEVVEGAARVDVEAGELWFTPDTIEVVAGEPVNLRLVNTGAAFHDLTVPAADMVLAAESGEDASGAIELSEPGSYEFYCSVPGHAAGGMRGTIVVSP